MSKRTFRDGLLKSVPGWLQRHVGSRYLFAIGAQLDALGDAVVEGIAARFPDKAPEEALHLIGRDRRIVRGFDESSESYRARLRQWVDSWRQAGSAFAVMQQVQGYLSGHEVRLRVVTNTGCWYTLDADGTRSYHRATPGNFNWDNAATKWSRFWLVIYPPSTLWEPGPTWGSASLWAGAWGSSGYTWGSTATPEQVTSIRSIINDWKSAHSRCLHIIVAFDPTSFDPTASPGSPLPDGTWGRNSDSGEPRGKARLATARYWRGTV